MATGSPGREIVERLAEEFAERYRRGERPAVSEYAERYPDHAAQIRDLFPALVMMEQVAPGSESEDLAGFGWARQGRAARHPVQIGDYRILRELGRGGMGIVYEAEQMLLGRRVALKVLPRQVFSDASVQERFRREARSVARLHHTNIVPVFQVGQEGDFAFYAMQLIQGQGLNQVIEEIRRLREPALPPRALGAEIPASDSRFKRKPEGETAPITDLLMSGRLIAAGPRPPAIDTPARAGDIITEELGAASTSGRTPGFEGAPSPPLPPGSGLSGSAVLPGGKHVSEVDSSGQRQAYFRSVAQIGRQAAQGLAHAHARGIIHRDIKPSNLLLDTAGILWITDFGLAKDQDDGDALTAPGDVLGTLRYMAPERFRGEGDARVDVYGLGLTIYELMSLRPAFDSSDRLKLIEHVKDHEPRRPRMIDGRIPRDLETIVMKAIDKDPGRRYRTADEMAEDLRRFLADEPIKARAIGVRERYWRWARRNPTVAVLGTVLAAVLVLVTAGSLLVAGRYAGMVNRERSARGAAQSEARRAALNERKAVTERRRADSTLADMFTSRGLLAGERDASAEASLWFAEAARLSAIAEDPGRLEDNRCRARNWLRQTILPVAALSVASRPRQLEFQPRGDLLLVLAAEDRAILWSWRDDRRLPWTEALVGVGSARFSPDGASVALGFLSGEAQIRHVTDGAILARIGHAGPIRALEFSPDGGFLAIASDTARLWDIRGRAFRDPTWSHPQRVTALAFNRKGDRLITACADKQARVFAVEGGRDGRAPLYNPVPHGIMSAPALMDEDRILVTISEDTQIARWDMASGLPVTRPMRDKSSRIAGVAASPDGNWLAAGGGDGPELFAKDVSRPPIQLNHLNEVRRLVFSPDSTMLLSTSLDQTARLWSLAGNLPKGQPLAHMAIVDGCAWSGDSRHMATAQVDGLIRVWRRPVDDLVLAREIDWGQRPRIGFDGRLVVPGLWHESASNDATQLIDRLRVLSTADGRPACADIALPGTLVDSCVAGDNLAVAAVTLKGNVGQLGVWDVATARGRFAPITLPGIPLSVAARPGGRQLAVICSTGDLLVIDDRTGARVLESRHEAWAGSERSVRVEYTPDGKSLVSLGGMSPATINVRDADSGRLRFAPLTSTVAGSNFHSFSLSADARLLATIALIKNAAQVWDLETGRPLSDPLLHPGDFWGLFSARFAPDGRHLLTSHKDGQVRYWDWRAGKLACPPMAHQDEVPDTAITPDGRFALTVVRNRPEIHVWELTTGRRIAPPVRPQPVAASWCVTSAITPDGRRALVSFAGVNLVVVDLEKLLSRSPIPTDDLELLAGVTTARRIELGDLSGLTTDRWRELWQRLREGGSDLTSVGQPGPPEPIKPPNAGDPAEIEEAPRPSGDAIRPR